MTIERLMTGDFIACFPFPHVPGLPLENDPVQRYWDVMRSTDLAFSTTLELRARCPACRTTGDVDLRTLDWHRGAAATALTPGAFVSLLPAECAVCRTPLPVQVERCR